MFMFPGTAALLLREHTWLSEVAIASWLHHYAHACEGEGFTVKSRQPGNHHYHVAAAPGGFRVRAVRLPLILQPAGN
jgi:hypothetical protein